MKIEIMMSIIGKLAYIMSLHFHVVHTSISTPSLQRHQYQRHDFVPLFQRVHYTECRIQLSELSELQINLRNQQKTNEFSVLNSPLKLRLRGGDSDYQEIENPLEGPDPSFFAFVFNEKRDTRPESTLDLFYMLGPKTF